MATKKEILDTIDDLVSSLLYYDRKEDEELEVGIIEDMIKSEKILISEIVDRFEKSFREGIKCT